MSYALKVAAPQVVIAGETMSVHFDRFDIQSYELFLKVKRLPEYTLDFDRATETYLVSAPARFAPILGLELPRITLDALPHFQLETGYASMADQSAILDMALAAKRFAVWSDCGLGKTLIMLEFARQVAHLTSGRFLILTLNDIVAEFLEQAKQFYGDRLPILQLESRQQMKDWCAGRIAGPAIAITNYEKMNPDEDGQVVNELRMLAGIGLDESSRLKTGGGKQKWAIIHSSKGIPYKLSCTATPAPNETMEFASQASFLEKMRSEGEIIWTYFTRDPQTQEWIVKPHARKAFFNFMSSWSIYVKNPKRYGWRLDMPEIPEPEIIEHRIPLTAEQRQFIFESSVDDGGQTALFGSEDGLGMVERSKHSQVAKGFIYVNGPKKTRTIKRFNSLKPEYVAKLIAAERMAGLSVLVWTIFDEESTILAEALGQLPSLSRPPMGEVGRIDGDTKDSTRRDLLTRFKAGTLPILISKATMLGYGQNLQQCGSMIFNGWNDSFEQWYQAIRRAYRFGNTKRLRVHIPQIAELEGQVLENVQRKEAEFNRNIEDMEASYIAAFAATHLLQTGRAA